MRRPSTRAFRAAGLLVSVLFSVPSFAVADDAVAPAAAAPEPAAPHAVIGPVLVPPPSSEKSKEL